MTPGDPSSPIYKYQAGVPPLLPSSPVYQYQQPAPLLAPAANPSSPLAKNPACPPIIPFIMKFHVTYICFFYLKVTCRDMLTYQF